MTPSIISIWHAPEVPQCHRAAGRNRRFPICRQPKRDKRNSGLLLHSQVVDIRTFKANGGGADGIDARIQCGGHRHRLPRRPAAGCGEAQRGIGQSTVDIDPQRTIARARA